ncbi:MAG: hypothetical protein IKT00_11120 [Prevotella sp.]|nr:hypothetical protein [Prevotella sp.]
MAKVKYYAKENTKLGTHSFYAVPVPNGTLTFNELCEEACRNTSIEPSIMKAAVSEYMKTVLSNVLKGFRVPVGEQFITVYPNLNCSVKDTKNQDGTVNEAATAKKVTASKGMSRLGASVSIKFSKQFTWKCRGRRLTRLVRPSKKRTSPMVALILAARAATVTAATTIIPESSKGKVEANNIKTFGK